MEKKNIFFIKIEFIDSLYYILPYNMNVIENLPAHYVPYNPEHIKKHNTIAFKAAMEVLFAHTADVFSCIVDIIADKYELNADDIMETVVNHPKYTSLTVHPVINSLSYFTADDAVTALTTPIATATPAVKKILKIKRTPK